MKSSWFKNPKVKLEVCKNEPKEIIHGVFDSIFGSIFLAYSHESLIALMMSDDEKYLKKQYKNSKLIKNDKQAYDFFKSMLLNEKDIKVLVKGTPFQVDVWKALLDVEKPKTVCYTDISNAIKKPKAVRAVANAIGDNPIIYLIPCHRVLRKDGGLGGFSCGIEKKIAFLEYEKSGCI